MNTHNSTQSEEAPEARLWHLWRQGQHVEIADFLAGLPPLGTTDLVAVLLVDQRERWQIGERIPAENYLRRFPVLESDSEAVVEMAFGEFLLREERGERPALQEYVRRFPEQQTRLRQQIALHQATMPSRSVGAPDLTLELNRSELPNVPVIPGYEILVELGRGGMGVVYKARQVKANRLVALKMLLAGGHAASGELERFRSEAEAIARLQHPNIVQVFEVGEQGGIPFFSIEFCPGGSLDHKLAGKALPPREAAALVERLALAVQAAHEKQIIHRDLKPANILLSADGTLRITDFGLARKLDEAGQTATGAILGTPSYMAPEQASGKTHEVGPLADVYSLGAILYECLTGRPPFKAATYADTVLQVLEQEPVPPLRNHSATTRDLETICLKCLLKDRAGRYGSAGELAEDLRRFLEDRPIKARRTPGHERARRWCKRNPVVAGLTAAVAVALMLGSAGAAFFAVRANENAVKASSNADKSRENAHKAQENERKAVREKEEADAARSRETKAREEAVRTRREFQDHLYFAEMYQAGQAAASVGAIGRVNELLERWRPASAQRDRRGWEWYYLRGLSRECLMTLRRHTARVTSLSWRPDGQHLASGSEDGTIRVWNPMNGREVTTIQYNLNPVYKLAWSPDGRRLASAGNRVPMHLWDPVTGRPLTQVRQSEDMRAISWTPDGRQLVSIDSLSNVRMWQVDTHRQTDLILANTRCDIASVSPDARWIAHVGEDRNILVHDTRTKRETTLPTSHSGRIRALSWHPKEWLLASGGSDGVIVFHDVAKQREISALRGHTGALTALSWSADGQFLASAGTDQTIRVWDKNTRSETAVLRGHTSAVNGISWSPDGRRLASAGDDQTVRLWDVRTVPDPAILRGSPGAVDQIRWAADNRRLATLGENRSLRLWDTDTGKQLEIKNADTISANALRWRPDGLWAASKGVDGGLQLRNVSSGRTISLIDRNPFGTSELSWSPDGRLLVTWGRTDDIEVWSTESAKVLFALHTSGANITTMEWSPDGRFLASATRYGSLEVWDMHARRALVSLPGHTAAINAVSWSPNSQLLASAGRDLTIRIWDVSRGVELVSLRGHSINVHSVSWHPEGHRLASAGADGTVRLWDIATGRETLSVRGHSDDVTAVCWSPNGRRLAYAGNDGTIRILDVTPGFIADRSGMLLPEIDRRVKAGPTSSDLQLRAEIKARLGHWDEAATDWTSARQRDGNKSNAWFPGGWWVSGAHTPPSVSEITQETEPISFALQLRQGAKADGPALGWRAATASANGCLELSALFPQTRGSSVFAILRVYSPREQEIAAHLGATGRLRFWHNGRLSHEADHQLSPDIDDGVPLTLHSGWNTLLFQIDLATGTDRLYVWLSAQIEARAGAFADRGQWAQARGLVTDALKQHPDRVDLLLAAGRIARREAQSLRRQAMNEQAVEVERQIRVYYEKLLALRPGNGGYAREYASYLLSRPEWWEIPEPLQMDSAGGTSLTRLPDNSILASGKNPLPEIYTITTRTQSHSIAAFRLELLLDASLPARGPGRAAGGCMGLNEFRVTAAAEDQPDKTGQVVLHNAWADVSQPGCHVSGAIDGDAASQWAIGPEYQQPHTAIFEVKNPLAPAKATILTFALDQHVEYRGFIHNLGRFRLSIATHSKAVAEEKLWIGLLKKKIDTWTMLGFAHYLREEWQSALAVLTKSVESPSGSTGYDRVMLSRVCARLGRHQEARKWYDQSVAWLTKNPIDEPLLELAIDMVSEQIAREPKDAGLPLQRARWYAQRKRRPEALADFTRAVELDPALVPKQEDAQLLVLRAESFIRRGEWQKASADFARVVGFPKVDADDWFAHALVLLHRGDTAGYKKTCTLMYERFASSSERDNLLWLARTCSLAPNAVDNYDVLARGLEKAVADTPNWCRYRHSSGGLLYRMGKTEAAVRRLDEVIRLHHDTGLVSDWLILSMALHRQGRTADARKWFDRAVRYIDQTEKTRTQHQPNSWFDRVELQLLRKEAEMLLKGG